MSLRRKRARIIPSPDGKPGFVVHPDDRPVRELPIAKPTLDEPPPPTDVQEDDNGK